MMSVKTRPRVGDTRWVVRYCIERGMCDKEHPEYGGDPDQDVNRVRFATTEQDAEAIAREVYPLDQYGCVCYCPQEFVAYDEDDAVTYPHAGYWTDTGDGGVYDGEPE